MCACARNKRQLRALKKAEEIGGLQIALRREDGGNDVVKGEASREVRHEPRPGDGQKGGLMQLP